MELGFLIPSVPIPLLRVPVELRAAPTLKVPPIPTVSEEGFHQRHTGYDGAGIPIGILELGDFIEHPAYSVVAVPTPDDSKTRFPIGVESTLTGDMLLNPSWNISFCDLSVRHKV